MQLFINNQKLINEFWIKIRYKIISYINIGLGGLNFKIFRCDKLMWKFCRDLLEYISCDCSIEYKSRWECISVIFIIATKLMV